MIARVGRDRTVSDGKRMAGEQSLVSPCVASPCVCWASVAKALVALQMLRARATKEEQVSKWSSTNIQRIAGVGAGIII